MKKIAMGLAAGLMVLTGICAAQGPDIMDGDGVPVLPGGKWWNNPSVAAQLKLTQDEQAKIYELFVAHHKKMIDLKAALDKDRLEMEQLFEKKDFDEAACTTLFKKLLDTRAELGTERFRFIVEIRKLLGADRFETLMSKHRERRQERIKDLRKSQKRPIESPPEAIKPAKPE